MSHDRRFLRAVALGAALGIPLVWAVITVIFTLTRDEPWTDVAGYALVPAVFCGPFIGGLFTTALLGGDETA